MTPLIEALISETGLRSADLLRVMRRAPDMYRVYHIAKRTGGLREIAQPAREVKYVQRAITEVLLNKLPVHDAAVAYRKGKSIRDNALAHAGNGPILKLDFKDFFPSIRSRDWISYCRAAELDLTDEDLMLTARLLFYRPAGGRLLRLAVGAPSSPALSNVLLYDFDRRIVENLENDKVRYTRYADDMTFSAPRTGYLNGVMKTVATAIRTTQYPKLSINAKKTTYVTRKFGREVTGLVLANDGSVTIGRDRKRLIRAAVYRAKTGKLSSDELRILAGMLAFVNVGEPEFLNNLKRVYGADLVLAIQKNVRRGGGKLPVHLPPLAMKRDSAPEGEAAP